MNYGYYVLNYGFIFEFEMYLNITKTYNRHLQHHDAKKFMNYSAKTYFLKRIWRTYQSLCYLKLSLIYLNIYET